MQGGQPRTHWISLVPASMSQMPTPNPQGDPRGVVPKLRIVKGKSWLKSCGFGVFWDVLSIPVAIPRTFLGPVTYLC